MLLFILAYFKYLSMNPHTFILFMFFLALMDIIYTLYNVNILRKHKTKWHDTEYNPLVRNSWHMFGFFKGSAIAALITLSCIIIVSIIIWDNIFLQGVLIGMYLMLHHLHYVNYAYISKKYLKKELPVIGRIITEW